MNVFSTEMLMFEQQLEIEKEARKSWMWAKEKTIPKKMVKDTKVFIPAKSATACCAVCC
jgi:hypothetical protein